MHNRDLSGIFWIPVEQFDRDSLWPAQKANLDSRTRGVRLLRELHTLFSEIRRDGIDSRDGKAEMIETLIGGGRRRIDTISRRDLGRKDHRSSKPDIDAWLALLRRADHLCAEHALKPLRHALRIRSAQMDVIPGKIRHWRSPMTARKTRQDNRIAQDELAGARMNPTLDAECNATAQSFYPRSPSWHHAPESLQQTGAHLGGKT